MNNKKEFTACLCDVITFIREDVITASSIVLEDDDFLIGTDLMS